jgi:hypothetical protein
VTPQPMSAATSRGMSSRIFTTAPSCTSICSAKLDRSRNWKTGWPSFDRRVGWSKPRWVAVLVQRFGLPAMQKSHCPQNTERQVMTWSPGFTWVTWSPTASTMPADSWPRTAGVMYGYLPSMKWRSE